MAPRMGLSRRKKISRKRSFTSGGGFSLSNDTKRGIFIIILFSLSFLSILSFFQATGDIGTYITGILGSAFGWADWIFPILLLILSYFLLRPGTFSIRPIHIIGLLFILIGLTGLLHLSVRDLPLKEITGEGKGGGFIGYLTAQTLYNNAEFTGALIVLCAVLIIGLFIFFNTSFRHVVQFIHDMRIKMQGLKVPRPTWGSSNEEDYSTHFDNKKEQETVEDESVVDDESDEAQLPLPAAATMGALRSVSAQRAPKKNFPKIDLPLDLLSASTEVPSSGDIKLGSKKIESTLASFGIAVTMGEVNIGPTVTQYTLKPADGVKLTQITALHSDLALALAAHPIRIEAPIPGKSLVGIEVPNQAVSIVKLKDVLTSPAYTNRASNLMLSLGKDVTGKASMADLARMPHLLIAGATGSGKSVAINSMIVSLVYQNSPELLKLILVDPKRVELSSYDSIPHLLAPVITETDKTINALRWTVREMDERYKLLQAANKKNISSYNDSRLVDKMPYIVIVIDELADLMMVAAKEVEAAIIRLAQMARAVGIHLILATQRPSVNVITGLIKANITSRIAFAVASSTDSRTILDSSGAEKLLGNGDMLFISAELSRPKRIQGAYISDKEITAVTDYLKERGEPQYEAAVTERRQGRTSAASGFNAAEDEDERDMFLAAEAVIKAKRASATLLQSRMRVGFAKASRLLDLLEERGIIGPQNSSKPREVLVTLEEFRQQFGDGGGTVIEEVVEYEGLRAEDTSYGVAEDGEGEDQEEKSEDLEEEVDEQTIQKKSDE